ncbi:hypothetical protein [Frankia sp. R82]|nr:hypothetical protein [Frankia sp. R82]
MSDQNPPKGMTREQAKEWANSRRNANGVIVLVDARGQGGAR